jgi:hypothetical protein
MPDADFSADDLLSSLGQLQQLTSLYLQGFAHGALPTQSYVDGLETLFLDTLMGGEDSIP